MQLRSLLLAALLVAVAFPAASSSTWVAPFWGGSGGFTVVPVDGRNSVTVKCGRSTREYEAENGIVTRLVEGDCRGAVLQIEGAASGGWYWQNGERNVAVAALLQKDAAAAISASSVGSSDGSPMSVAAASSDAPRAVVPGGVTYVATESATWFRHDTSQLVGIVPHLADNECSEYGTPYWRGHGGLVARPVEGRESVRVKVKCGRTYSSQTLMAGDDGVAVGLIERSYCVDREGNPKEGELTVTGAEPGGWYWIKGERNAAVGPLMCPDLLGGPKAVDPGGVVSLAGREGTYFQHEVEKLAGVVPHVSLSVRSTGSNAPLLPPESDDADDDPDDDDESSGTTYDTDCEPAEPDQSKPAEFHCAVMTESRHAIVLFFTNAMKDVGDAASYTVTVDEAVVEPAPGIAVSGGGNLNLFWAPSDIPDVESGQIVKVSYAKPSDCSDADDGDCLTDVNGNEIGSFGPVLVELVEKAGG